MTLYTCFTIIISFLFILPLNGTHEADLIDLSDDCTNGLKVNYFLTNGMGEADGVTLLFASQKKHCVVNVYTHEDEKIVQVLAMDGVRNGSFCKPGEILVLDVDERIDVCENVAVLRNRAIFVGAFSSHKMTIFIKTNEESLRLTALSARVLKNDSCDKKRSVFCIIDTYRLCIDVELICSILKLCKNNLYYENEKCKEQLEQISTQMEWKFLAVGIAAALILSFLVTICCKQCALKIPKQYFKANETTNSLFIPAQSSPKRTISTKQVHIRSPSSFRKENRTSNKELQVEIPWVCSGDRLDLDELLKSHRNENVTEKLKKKRLTTNSPVYRNEKTSGFLLETIKEFERSSAPSFSSSTESELIQLSLSQRSRHSDHEPIYSKRRRHADLI